MLLLFYKQKQQNFLPKYSKNNRIYTKQNYESFKTNFIIACMLALKKPNIMALIIS